MDHPVARPRIDIVTVPFEQTAAFRRFGAEVMPDPDDPGEPYTRAIIEEQGFAALPHVVSSRQLDAYVVAGETELFRGVSDAAYAAAFRYGPFFVGRGSYGSGAYAVGGPDARALARDHSGPGVILRMTLKAVARIADYDELQEAAYRTRESAIRHIRQEGAQAEITGGGVGSRERRARSEVLVEAEHAKYDDLGRYAAYLGFDALHVEEREYYVILNRTAVRVQREDLR